RGRVARAGPRSRRKAPARSRDARGTRRARTRTRGRAPRARRCARSARRDGRGGAGRCRRGKERLRSRAENRTRDPLPSRARGADALAERLRGPPRARPGVRVRGRHRRGHPRSARHPSRVPESRRRSRESRGLARSPWRCFRPHRSPPPSRRGAPRRPGGEAPPSRDRSGVDRLPRENEAKPVTSPIPRRAVPSDRVIPQRPAPSSDVTWEVIAPTKEADLPPFDLELSGWEIHHRRPSHLNAVLRRNGRRYHLKWFFHGRLWPRPSPAEKEHRNALRVSDLGIPTVVPVGWGRHPRGTFFVMEGSPGHAIY